MFISIFAVQLFFVLQLRSTNGLIVKNLKEQNCSAILNATPQKSKHGSLMGERQMSECPPWFRLDNQTGVCHSGPQLGGIIQQDKRTLQTSLLECYCMTEKGGILTVGACMYTCNAISGYFPLPCHVSQLESFLCADLNRRGLLCGQCMDNYSLPVYSYELKCVKCEDYQYNWLKYLAFAFLPLTIFYILVTLLSISFTSPLLSALVMACQVVAQPIQLSIYLSFVESGTMVVPKQFVIVAASFGAFLNLDFFRMAYTPFCLHPSVSAMEVMALDYATAVYPVLLIGITNVMVRLHDHHFKPLVWAWKLCGLILKPLRKQWNVKTSLVDVFASFIFLSSSRLLLASMNFLVPIKVYAYPQNSDVDTQPTIKHYLLNAPTVEYFGREHLPFAFLAITISILLFVLPMILLFVYPFRWFQRLLNKLGLNSLILRTFMEVFQGSFKDGTNGTKDYRYFSGFLLLLVLVLNLTFASTVSSFYFPIASIFILLYLILHLMFQPFKQRLHNYITAGMTTALLVAYCGIIINIGIVSIKIVPFEHGGTTKGVWLVSIILIFAAMFCIVLHLLGLVCVLAKRTVYKLTRRHLV